MSGGGTNEHDCEIPRRCGGHGGKSGVEEQHRNRRHRQFPTKGRINIQPAEVFGNGLQLLQ